MDSQHEKLEVMTKGCPTLQGDQSKDIESTLRSNAESALRCLASSHDLGKFSPSKVCSFVPLRSSPAHVKKIKCYLIRGEATGTRTTVVTRTTQPWATQQLVVEKASS
jgi:hypothetical protein